MYRCYLINFGWFMEGTFETVAQAIEHGKSKGFEFSVQCAGRVYAAWSPLSGTTVYEENL